MRTVTVLEHDLVPVVPDARAAVAAADPWLTEEEAQALLGLNEQRRGFCQRVASGVKLAQYCGIVRLPGCVVEVLPKIGMGDARTPAETARGRAALLAMLQGAGQVAISRVGTAPQQAVHAPLLDIFIEAFLHAALAQARRGLLSRYVTHTDDLPVIKGRFDAHGHVRCNAARPHLLHCQFDEFTADNAFNRAIRATLDACRPWVSRAATQRLWFETHSRFLSTTHAMMSAADVARLPRDRTTHRYASVLQWCEWLLAMESPALSAGAQQAPGLLFDMNKLFEAHVAEREVRGAGDARLVHTQGPHLHLARRGAAPVFQLRPDITVWHIGPRGEALGIDRVVDAKWKRLSPHLPDFGVEPADIYQLLTYAVAYRCFNLELAYPLPDGFDGAEAPAFAIPLEMNGAVANVNVRLKLIPLVPEEDAKGRPG